MFKPFSSSMFNAALLCTLGCDADAVKPGKTPQDAASSDEAGVSDTRISATKICDGSPSIRLRAYVESQPSREAAGAAVQSENGYRSIAIDGMCRYWIDGTWEEGNQGWKTGVLADDTARSLEANIDIGRLEDLGDCRPEGRFDLPFVTIRSPLSRVRCLGEGVKFDQAFSIFTALAPQLLASGEPLTGGVRVVAVDTFSFDGDIVYEWPILQPIADFVLPRPISDDPSKDQRYMVGVSKLVADPDATVALRAFRERYLQNVKQGRRGREAGPVVKSGNQFFVVYMRDQLPYEDAKGLLALSENQ